MYEQVPPGSVLYSSTNEAANGAPTTTIADWCSSVATDDDAMAGFESSADGDQDPPAAANEQEEEEEEEVPRPELPPVPPLLAGFVSSAAWAAMSAATRTLLANGVPTLVKSVHREKEEMVLAGQRVRVGEEPRAPAVSPPTTTPVPVEEPDAMSPVLHCNGISSRQAAADKEALISSTARFAAEQRRVASLQPGNNRDSSSCPGAMSFAMAAEGPQGYASEGPQEPQLTPAPQPQNGAYVYKRHNIDVSFIGILLTVIASHRQPSFRKHDAPAVMEAAGSLARELKDFPGATLAYALGHAAATTSSSSSLTTSAHELLLALRAAYRNACRPIAWPQLPRSIAPVAVAETEAFAVPAVAQRNVTGGGETSDGHNSGALASSSTTNHGQSRRGRRHGPTRDPVFSRAASKIGLNGRRLSKEKSSGSGNNGSGRGRGKTLRRPAVPHPPPPPPPALFQTPAPALLPPHGGARSSLQRFGW